MSTDNEIIKALECYIKENEFEYFHSNTMNEYPLIRKALDLINRQKAEIERLKEIEESGNRLIESLKKAFNDRTAELQQTKFDNKQLQIDVERIKSRRINDCRHWQEKYNSLRAEAVKEFAERLKKCSQWLPLVAIPEPFVIVSDIDNLVKEMVGEG